ncbi:hypothetical protein G8V30_08190 [Clostridium botulinum C/D]|uniref:polymorphic toxin-type HINT domain-containing protein n=1 Tax=Clostridium botulinum TaxID=1491 RepID=UPI001F99B4C8|nr:hypothetical protein [Clostridium botulinum C/D]MCD3286875.1 hypothetical protein [Clostridium botulinum C/D]MCD3290964.1 hypothetical protein [Clostridium botulinum C/D]MCD3301693.1 hypothetical protein [Clostridium botulinum C/D]
MLRYIKYNISSIRVIGEGWVEAGNLKVGDKVPLYSGKVTEVSRINLEILKKPVKVYNFEVEDWHMYFVSHRNVLVHNMCAQPIKHKYFPSKRTARQRKENSLHL